MNQRLLGAGRTWLLSDFVQGTFKKCFSVKVAESPFENNVNFPTGRAEESLSLTHRQQTPLQKLKAEASCQWSHGQKPDGNPSCVFLSLM